MIEHEAVRDCMKRNGFTYEIPVYVSSPESSIFESQVFQDQGAVTGYGATAGALALMYLPTGAPPEALDEAETKAYDIALLGVHGDHTHGHSSGDGHTHEDTTSGCRGVGSDAVVDLPQPVDAEKWHRGGAEFGSIYGEVRNFDSYNRYATDWTTCMKENGYVAEDPLFHWVTVQNDRVEQLTFILQQDPAIEESVRDYVNRHDSRAVVDEKWIDGLLSEVSEIRSLFDEELIEAKVDNRCRRSDSEGFADDVRGLEDALSGT